VLVDSPISPNDDDRDGVRGEWGCACEGDRGTIGDIGAMIPSALRDDDRRRPGIKPNSNRGSKERDRCTAGGRDVAEMNGELIVSRVPSCVFSTNAPGEKVLTGILTGCRERIVVGAQAEEKEQRCEPDADPKEGRHITEGGRFHHGPAAICLVRHLTHLVRDMCEMEEPHKMVDDD
jgi:hypothetical protein